ncbi:hypothetical protein LK07_30550 [Streptomyces pluripotens]|uniref:Integral membrane protein n=2 Tax=Streptomyces pluripotens TaxID=1355015 RepID=A0A221P5X4_9ACTN|nr:hypothetical protein LK06_029370 [Streptomyces pluripotens]ASN27659.1 hypothetical protein LK07_30550 [Streptomyces pluripotens]
MAAAMNVPMRAAADLRLLRAAVFSAVCVALSASGHALASGSEVPLWSLAAGWVGIAGVAGALAGRERSLPGIALTLLTGEIGLHLLFCLGQNSMTMAPSVKRSASVVTVAERLLCGPRAAHLTPLDATRILQQARLDVSGSVSALHGAPGMPGMARMTGHGGLTAMLGSMFTPSMLAAHVAAALLTGWVLRRCEIAVWQAVRLPAVALAHLLRLMLLWRLSGLLATVRCQVPMTGLLERILAALGAHRRADNGSALRLRSAVLRTCAARRGPPALASVA